MEIPLEEYNDLVDRFNRQLDEKKHKRRMVRIFAHILAAMDVEFRGNGAKSVAEYIRLIDERADENNAPCLSAADAVNSICPELFASICKIKEHQQCQK